MWSLLAQPDISVRTVGRIMALNRLVYDDIPHVPKRGSKPPPRPPSLQSRIAISIGLLTGAEWTLPWMGSSGGA